MHRARTLRLPKHQHALPRALPVARTLHTTLPPLNAHPRTPDDAHVPRPSDGRLPPQRSPLGEYTTAAAHWTAPSVEYEQVREWASRPSESILLIDVREPPEIAQGSIPSSVALPLSELKDALRLSPAAFRARYGFEMPVPSEGQTKWGQYFVPRTAQGQEGAPSHTAEGEGEGEGEAQEQEKQKQIIFYCRSGKRSLTACDLAVRAGWQGVRNYDGSWLDWVRREQERAAGGK